MHEKDTLRCTEMKIMVPCGQCLKCDGDEEDADVGDEEQQNSTLKGIICCCFLLLSLREARTDFVFVRELLLSSFIQFHRMSKCTDFCITGHSLSSSSCPRNHVPDNQNTERRTQSPTVSIRNGLTSSSFRYSTYRQ